MPFQKGNGGKPKGAVNKTTAVLKNAILLAAERSGGDQKGKNKLVGYLKRVADEDMKAFCGLLGRVLPLEVTGDNGDPLLPPVTRVIHTFTTEDDASR